MRKKNWLILLCAGLLSGFGGSLAAMPNGGGMVTIEADSTQDSPYLAIEYMPRFPGGDVTKWLAKNTRYPKAALERKAEGKVFVQFVIEKDGRVTNVKVLRPVDPDLDREAVRVVSSMPRWKPGKQRGKFVRVPYMVPINFWLKSGKGEATAEPDVDAYVLTGNEVRTPLFPGNWNKWIEKRIREEGYGYSDDEGVMVRFVVETDGRITKIQTRKEEDVELGRAAAAIIADMPDWVPGTVNGTPARMRQVVRVPMEDSVYMVVEEMPKFPEGDVTRWIAEHMEYSPVGCGVFGKVFVKFVVEKDGRITNAQVLRPEDPVLDKEAIRLVESMPRWIPGKQDGKPVRVSYVVPVNFQLQ